MGRQRTLAEVIRLSPKQVRAMECMRRCASYDDGWAVVCSNGTATYGGQAYIDHRTAMSLVRRDLAELDESLGRVRLYDHDERKTDV